MSSILDDLEADLMTNPVIRAEVERLAPVLRNLSPSLLVALSIAMRRESARRTAPEPRPVRIGNR
jgi:hypothetical protein